MVGSKTMDWIGFWSREIISFPLLLRLLTFYVRITSLQQLALSVDGCSSKFSFYRSAAQKEKTRDQKDKTQSTAPV